MPATEIAAADGTGDDSAGAGQDQVPEQGTATRAEEGVAACVGLCVCVCAVVVAIVVMVVVMVVAAAATAAITAAAAAVAVLAGWRVVFVAPRRWLALGGIRLRKFGWVGLWCCVWVVGSLGVLLG